MAAKRVTRRKNRIDGIFKGNADRQPDEIIYRLKEENESAKTDGKQDEEEWKRLIKQLPCKETNIEARPDGKSTRLQ